MKANELRIGNWVKPINPRHEEKYLIIESITSESVNIDFREYLLSDFLPIPLTPEILEKCGFKRGNEQPGGYYGYSNGILELDNNFGVALYDGRLDDVATKEFYPEIKYLHQLQNLYFALTGEELEMKL